MPAQLAVFDARILDELRITPAQLRVYLAVMATGAWDGRHWTPIKTKPLAEGLGVSQRTVYAALRRLTDLGYVDRTRVGHTTLVRRFSALDLLTKGDVVDDYESHAQTVTAQSIPRVPSARQLLPRLGQVGA